MVRRVEHQHYKEKLKEEGLIILKNRQHWENLRAAFHYLRGTEETEPGSLHGYTSEERETTDMNLTGEVLTGHKEKKLKKKKITITITEHCNKLSKDCGICHWMFSRSDCTKLSTTRSLSRRLD